MQKNVPKSIIDDEKEQLQAQTFADYLRRGEKRSFTKKTLEAKAFMNLYTPEQRIIMVEDEGIEESTSLLINLRKGDVSKCYETMIKGLALYLKDCPTLRGSHHEILERCGRIILVLEGLMDIATRMSVAEVRLDSKFRGTLGGFCTVGVDVVFKNGDIEFEFSNGIGVYQFKDENLVDMYVDNKIENAPRKYNAFNYKTKITNFRPER